MPQWDSLAAFGRSLAGFEGDLTGAETKKIVKLQAAEAERIAAKAATRDLGGDRAFSGWVRGKPIALDTRLRNVTDGIMLTPSTKRSAGPWTVAESGRNSAAGPRLIGPRLTKSGRVSRARRKRYNGRTIGKDTATKATAEMDRKLPPIAKREVLKISRKRFTVT